MKTYQNKESVKAKYLKRVKAHQDADHLIQGYGYWKGGKGCALGCTMEQDTHTHEKFDRKIAPQWLAHLIDHIFESLPEEAARKWTYEVLEAIPTGIPYERLNAVRDRLQIRWLKHNLKTVTNEEVKIAVKQVITLLTRAVKGNEPTFDQWLAANSAVNSVANVVANVAADSATWAVAYSATWAAARSVANAAASSAAYSAAASSAAYSATWAAYLAAKSARHNEAGLKRRWILSELRSLTTK